MGEGTIREEEVPLESNQNHHRETGKRKCDNMENLCQTESPSIRMSPSAGKLWDL